jgi:hypothetical protein
LPINRQQAHLHPGEDRSASIGMVAFVYESRRPLPKVAHKSFVLTRSGALDRCQGFDQRVDDRPVHRPLLFAFGARRSGPVGRFSLLTCPEGLWCLDAFIHAVSIQERSDDARARRSMRDVTFELLAMSISFPRYFNEM